MHPVVPSLLALCDRTPHPARPILAATLARNNERLMPDEIALFLVGRLGAIRQPDPVLDAVQAIAYRSGADESRVAAAWRTIRCAPRDTARAAVRALRAHRDAVHTVARHAATRRARH